MAEAQAELLPAAVFGVFERRQQRLLDADSGARIRQNLLDAAIRHGVRPFRRTVRAEWLLRQRDPQRPVS